jgi:hypothetical protein
MLSGIIPDTTTTELIIAAVQREHSLEALWD